MSGTSISFESLGRAHFDQVRRWLEEPLVARWWNHESTAAAVERDFGPAIDHTEPTEIFIANTGMQPFGLIQRYRIDAYPDYQRELCALCPVPPGTLSIDYLIGEPDHRSRGNGTAMIAAFIAASWSASPDAPAVLVLVSAGNRASWRALERAGLRRVAEGELEPDHPSDPRDHFVYRVDRCRPL